MSKSNESSVNAQKLKVFKTKDGVDLKKCYEFGIHISKQSNPSILYVN